MFMRQRNTILSDIQQCKSISASIFIYNSNEKKNSKGQHQDFFFYIGASQTPKRLQYILVI